MGLHEDYKVLIIGAGNQGSFSDAPFSPNENKVISFGHACALHHGLQLLGFVDLDIKKALRASAIWGGYATPKLKDATQADVYIVTTPDHLHYDVLMEILKECNPKLVICEKPICMELDDAREIVYKYKQAQVPLMVNYTRRYLPDMRALKDMYDVGKCGEAIRGTLEFNRGWVHTASHAIQLFQWFGIENYVIRESDCFQRVWDLRMFFEKYTFKEHRIGIEPVPKRFDKSTEYVMKNAYEFLEGNELIKCTGQDALKALEACYKLMREGGKL